MPRVLLHGLSLVFVSVNVCVCVNVDSVSLLCEGRILLPFVHRRKSTEMYILMLI